MTIRSRQHTDCYSFCSKVIKSFFTYASFNHTDTLLTGSHQHHEPVYNLPKIGWSGSILPTKLGSAHTGSMSPPNRGWIPPRIDKCSLPKPAASANKLLNREQSTNIHRGDRTSNQRGYCRDTNISTELCVSDFPSGKERRGPETSDKPKWSQLFYKDRALQDGRSSPPSRPSPTAGLDGENGLERCISASPHPQGTPISSDLSMGGQDLYVQMPTIWPIISTQSVHKAAEASGGFPEIE